jgi:hypothetical protein
MTSPFVPGSLDAATGETELFSMSDIFTFVNSPLTEPQLILLVFEFCHTLLPICVEDFIVLLRIAFGFIMKIFHLAGREEWELQCSQSLIPHIEKSMKSLSSSESPRIFGLEIRALEKLMLVKTSIPRVRLW